MQQAWTHLLRLCGTECADTSVPDLTNILRQHLDGRLKEADIFKSALWTYISAEHPDAALLPFLKARKWDVEKALIMLLSALSWRAQHHIDDDVILRGESVAHLDEPTADEKSFISQYRSGKSFVRGTDKHGRPVYFIRVRLHDPRAQSTQAMENYVLHNVESLKATLTFPSDQCCLVFDLTNFGLKNMDFHVVKFLVHIFETRYPEMLGQILIHKAPFVFWGMFLLFLVFPLLSPNLPS